MVHLGHFENNCKSPLLDEEILPVKLDQNVRLKCNQMSQLLLVGKTSQLSVVMACAGAKATDNPQVGDELSSGRHRLGDSHAFQRRNFKRQRHKLRDCHRYHPMTLFEGSSRNFCDRGRDVDLEEALCVDGLFWCRFNFVSGVNRAESEVKIICSVNDSRFGMQQPRVLCISISSLSWLMYTAPSRHRPSRTGTPDCDILTMEEETSWNFAVHP